MKLSGAWILEVIEQSIENVFTSDPMVKVGGMIQVSGLRFKYRAPRAKGHRITYIERTIGNWNAADDFVVVTNSMLAQGGHNQSAFHEGKSIPAHGSQYEMIKSALRRNSPIETPTLGRIERELDI